MSDIHDNLHAFADGELSAEEADAFRLHLGTCARCQAELEEVLQLQILGDQVRAEDAARTPVASLAERRAFQPAWSRRRAASALAMAAGAAVVFAAVTLRNRVGGEAPVALALADKRAIEGRLSYRGASDYRPYDVVRSGEANTGAQIPLKVLAELEERRDFHGLGAVYLLRGERERAAEYLQQAGKSPDVDSDLAVLALSKGALEEALILVDGALEKAPKHPQALWNRGLVLRQLGLTLLAAEAFDAVAALGERGWADEARQRAEALRRQADAAHQSWEQAWKAGEALAKSGTPMAPGLARQARGMVRGYFYTALWAATSSDEVRALLPLAQELDALYGGDRLAKYVADTAARDFTQRGPLSRQLRRILNGEIDRSGADALIQSARASGNTDLLLGILPKLQLLPERLPEYAAAAKALGDPWFVLNAELEQARASVKAGELAKAEAHLLSTLPACQREGADFRCLRMHTLLVDIYLLEHRLVEAREHAMAELGLSRQLGEWPAESTSLTHLGDIARFRNAFALTRAYLKEVALRPPLTCSTQVYLHESLAELQLFALQPQQARAELESAPRCDPPHSLLGAAVLADLARMDPRPTDIDSVRQAVEALRARGTLTPGERAGTDNVEGRALLQRDRETGKALLRRAIAAAEKLPREDSTAQKARAYSFSALILDAGKAGAYDEALALFAEEIAAPVPARCAVAVEVHDEQTLVVARGRGGELLGAYDGKRTSPDFDVARLVPANVLAALEGCEAAGVFARYPVHGRPGLLPASLAWSYRSGGARPSEPKGRARQLVISDVEAPASLGLPRLRAWASSGPSSDRTELSGPAATPSRVLAEMRDATEVQLHAHGLVNLGVSDASLVALSPEADGRYALTAADVRHNRLQAAPVVLLGACRAAQAAPYLHEPWSLPLAFLEAGARAVIASPADIPDAEAGPFFEGVLARVRSGVDAARALRDERVPYLSKDPHSWVQTVVVFQ